jgi:pimeloyl-ACP methyl ester carboxylesterase
MYKIRQYKLMVALLAVLTLLLIGYVYERVGAARDGDAYPAPGRLVLAGDHRLHVFCEGGAGPTVVIEQGAGELSRFWRPVQDKVAEFARVCTYDRAGYGWSERTRDGRTIEDRIDDLHFLLQGAKIPAPYILVAHSYGGLLVRAYQQKYLGEVAGMVLVDTPEESSIFDREVLDFYAKARIVNRVAGFAAQFGLLRLLRHWLPLDQYGLWLKKPEEYAALCDDLNSIERVPQVQRGSKTAGSLGSLPLIVMSHGIAFPGPFAVLEKNWSEGQRRLVALSSQAELIVANNSNHMIQQDEPGLVVEAIRKMHAFSHDADRSGSFTAVQ